MRVKVFTSYWLEKESLEDVLDQINKNDCVIGACESSTYEVEVQDE